MVEAEILLNELSNFTGTENYYKASVLSNLKLTDGMQHLRERADCYWLVTIVESVQHLDKIKANKEFILWRIEVKGKGFVVSAYRDSPLSKENLLYTQEGEYTDFPLKEYEFYQVDDTLLLKSEY